jgi:D-xylose reductase
MARPEESLLKHPVIEQIAAAQKRTPAQILLRWGVQRGTAVVPKDSANRTIDR